MYRALYHIYREFKFQASSSSHPGPEPVSPSSAGTAAVLQGLIQGSCAGVMCHIWVGYYDQYMGRILRRVTYRAEPGAGALQGLPPPPPPALRVSLRVDLRLSLRITKLRPPNKNFPSRRRLFPDKNFRNHFLAVETLDSWKVAQLDSAAEWRRAWEATLDS
jgi:hypothetical protein